MALLADLSRYAASLNDFRHADVRAIIQELLGASAAGYTAREKWTHSSRLYDI